MSKKSNNYSGYVLFESLIALGLLCLIIGSYISLNTFLLKRNRQANNQLSLHRVLYEEMKRYEHYGGSLIQDVHIDNSYYQLHFYKKENKLIEVEIVNGQERFKIKKK